MRKNEDGLTPSLRDAIEANRDLIDALGIDESAVEETVKDILEHRKRRTITITEKT